MTTSDDSMPFNKVDILNAIEFFGVNELLDAIGFERIERYLQEVQEDIIKTMTTE